jgi:hypothetical protein
LGQWQGIHFIFQKEKAINYFSRLGAAGSGGKFGKFSQRLD